jgi:hypothetical protein
LINGVLVVIPLFFGLKYIKGNKSFKCIKLGKKIYSHWVGNDNIHYGVNVIFDEHNVNSLIRRVVVDMNPMPPKVIGRKVCLHAKNPFGLSKDTRLKRHQTF